MALTYIYQVLQPSAQIQNASGSKIYTANANGVITGVIPADALAGLQSTAAAGVPKLIGATGATADRPVAGAAAASLTGVINNLAPFPPLGLPFYDTTLSNTAYFSPLASTGWVDRTGAAI